MRCTHVGDWEQISLSGSCGPTSLQSHAAPMGAARGGGGAQQAQPLGRRHCASAAPAGLGRSDSA